MMLFYKLLRQNTVIIKQTDKNPRTQAYKLFSKHLKINKDIKIEKGQETCHSVEFKFTNNVIFSSA